jgi:hypothetical protein
VVPELRDDFERRDVSGQAVVWSPIAPRPAAFDSVATVMLDVIDGEASIAELATDVHEVLGIPLDGATQQVVRVVSEFEAAGILTTSVGRSTAEGTIASADVFVASSTPCSENASRLATDPLLLRFGDKVIRLSCDSRRASRKLRFSLAEHLQAEVEGDEEPPLAFVLTSPQGLKRNHELTDRTGFPLSSGRGLDPGLHALASHLTAFVPPAPGTVRFRARALITNDRAILLMPPLLAIPQVEERSLMEAGFSLVDRLALDVDVATGRMVNGGIPWPSLAQLPVAAPHVGAGPAQAITDLVDTVMPGSPPPTAAATVARLAGNGVYGSPADLLDAAIHVIEGAQLRTTAPQTDLLLAALRG